MPKLLDGLLCVRWCFGSDRQAANTDMVANVSEQTRRGSEHRIGEDPACEIVGDVAGDPRPPEVRHDLVENGSVVSVEFAVEESATL
ncbi:MAG: hypothetical protein KGR69_15970, partial [Verrucomicrobia bacterium]|nr:hypothetical protein [Verrucomicrobiota bacterium]